MMNKKIKEFEPVSEVKNNESNARNEKIEQKKETSEEKEELGLKCDKCDYRAKQNLTLKKHINTKHKSNATTEETKEEKKNIKDTENKMKDVVKKNCIKCEKCENCDQCDFLQNHASCRICRIRFDATLKNLEKKDAELKEKLAVQKKREEWYRK